MFGIEDGERIRPTKEERTSSSRNLDCRFARNDDDDDHVRVLVEYGVRLCALLLVLKLSLMLLTLLRIGNNRNNKPSTQNPPRHPYPASTNEPTFPSSPNIPNSNSNNTPFPPRGQGQGQQQPTKGQSQNDRLYLCLPFVKAALVKGNFKTIVALPKCECTMSSSREKDGGRE